MPPKLNKEAPGVPVSAVEDEPDEEEKELVENELAAHCIQSRLNKHQESEERLFVENVRLEQELQVQKGDFDDIREYLQLQLTKKTRKIEELEKFKTELKDELERTKNAYKLAEEKLQKETASLKNELQKRTQEYNKKIKGTQDFLEQKEKLEEELASLKRSTEDKLREQQRKLADMERTHLQDRETWKRETAQKVKDAKVQMMQLTDNQLEFTTKRTILENEQMASELGYQSRQTEKMLHRNDMLLDNNAKMKIQIELAKETQDELARRNLTYQHAMQKLLNRLLVEKEIREANYREKKELAEQLLDERERNAILEMITEDQSETIRELSSQMRLLEDRLQEATEAKDETLRFLMQCMEDIKKKTVTVVVDKDSGLKQNDTPLAQGRLEDLSESQRTRALSYLLSKLQKKKPSDAANFKKRAGRGRSDSRCMGQKVHSLPDISRKATAGNRQKKLLCLEDFAQDMR